MQGVLLASASHLCQGQVDEAKDRFLDLLQAAVPARGAIEVRFDAPAPDFGRIASGFDFESGAFYRIHNGQVFGRSPDGVEFSGPERAGGVQSGPDSMMVVTAQSIDFDIPIRQLHHLKTHPEQIVSVQPGESGGYVVEYAYAGMASDAKEASVGAPVVRARLVVDADGIVKSSAFVEPPTLAIKFTYVEEGIPPGLVQAYLPTSSGAEWPLVEYTHHADLPEERFSAAAIEARALDVQTRHIPRIQTVTKETPVPSSISPQDRKVVRRGGVLSRWRWPLAGTGIVLVSAGVFGWWRRRSAA